MNDHKNSLWLPSYSSRVRGNQSECTLVFSDDDIDSPVLSKANVVILVDPLQLKLFEKRVRYGDCLMVESAGLTDTLDGNDTPMLPCPYP